MFAFGIPSVLPLTIYYVYKDATDIPAKYQIWIKALGNTIEQLDILIALLLILWLYYLIMFIDTFTMSEEENFEAYAKEISNAKGFQ